MRLGSESGTVAPTAMARAKAHIARRDALVAHEVQHECAIPAKGTLRISGPLRAFSLSIFVAEHTHHICRPGIRSLSAPIQMELCM